MTFALENKTKILRKSFTFFVVWSEGRVDWKKYVCWQNMNFGHCSQKIIRLPCKKNPKCFCLVQILVIWRTGMQESGHMCYVCRRGWISRRWPQESKCWEPQVWLTSAGSPLTHQRAEDKLPLLSFGVFFSTSILGKKLGTWGTATVSTLMKW